MTTKTPILDLYDAAKKELQQPRRFDLRGHDVHESHLHGYDFVSGVSMMLDESEMTKLVARRGWARASGGYHQHRCYNCGHRVAFELSAKTVRSQTACPFPEGYPEYSIQLPIPSGRIVFFNDMRNLFPLVEIPDRFYEIFGEDTHYYPGRPGDVRTHGSVNYVVGQRSYTELYAAHRLALICVGNTSPCIYDLGNDSLWVASFPEHKRPLGKEVGSICTGLWWYSACDYDLFCRLGGSLDMRVGWTQPYAVDVTPGTYEFTSRAHLVEESDYRKIRVYSRIFRRMDTKEMPV